MSGWIVLGLVVLAAVAAVMIYNRLVRSRNEVENSWHQIDVQLKRRHDLIPNLVETVKGYASHEQQTLEAVIAARNIARSAKGRGDRIQAESQLSGALTGLLAISESYPDLKANQNFVSLQEELSSTENRIAFARQYYNDTVMHYDNKRQQFPAVLFANMFGFEDEPYWRIEQQSERAVPQVSFS